MLVKQVRTLEDLGHVLSVGREHEHLEFKEARASFSLQKLIDYCVAFSNEQGGQIILGVTDKPPRQVVGTGAFENLEGTKKAVFDALRFRIDIAALDHPNGRVLVITIPSRGIGMPVQIDGRYLARVGESLVPMTPDQLRAIFDESRQPSAINAVHGRGYLCGERIRRVREDVGLKPSHLVELIGFPGERMWTQAESNRQEVAPEHLILLAELTGARVEWLKHGDGEPYACFDVNDFSWRRDMTPLTTADPMDLCAVIDPESMRCAVLHERSAYRVDTYLFTFDLGFWNWVDDHSHIPEIWRCFRWLHTERELINGLVVKTSDGMALFGGNLNAAKLLAANPRRSNWFCDLFDLERKHKHLTAEYRAHGEWFRNLQNSIKTWGLPGMPSIRQG